MDRHNVVLASLANGIKDCERIGLIYPEKNWPQIFEVKLTYHRNYLNGQDYAVLADEDKNHVMDLMEADVIRYAALSAYA